MSIERYSRRSFNSLIASAPLWPLAAKGFAAPTRELLITKSGAVADDATVNTKAIQAAINQLAAAGGGTVVVPKGVFVSGALFFKPKVNLRLTEGAFINAKNCDGFQLTGDGILDGAGMPVWELFWKNRAANKDFANTGMPRARLALIEDSKDVKIEGITFK